MKHLRWDDIFVEVPSEAGEFDGEGSREEADPAEGEEADAARGLEAVDLIRLGDAHERGDQHREGREGGGSRRYLLQLAQARHRAGAVRRHAALPLAPRPAPRKKGSTGTFHAVARSFLRSLSLAHSARAPGANQPVKLKQLKLKFKPNRYR